MSDRHKFYVTISDDSRWFSVECPYDLDDRTRPCWAINEDDTLDETQPRVCNYIEWLDNVGDEMVEGDRTFELTGAHWDWADYDSPVLRIEPA